ncbi:hypothetical protein [Methanobrevibacter sp.]|uniref:hypothetical protein n=1 Tax=Methanobrevibacter sp. TaxID=66852 RepID=UPI003868F1B6
MQNDSYNFGVIKVPTSWDEVTLLQFEKINEYYQDKEKTFNVVDVIDIFIDKDKDYIMSLPAEFLEIILDKLKFLSTEIETKEPSNKIEINNEVYQINFMEKLKAGEYIAVEMATKDNNFNYASVLAILCRKENEIFDSTFENEVLPNRVALFEKQPITKIIPLISFFMNCYILSVLPSQLSIQLKEGINQERKNIESLYESGQVSRRSMKSAMKTLKKLEKTINGI